MKKEEISEDPLRALFGGSATGVNREKLARLLKPFVSVDEGTQEFGFLPAFQALKNLERLEIVLAAVKARALLFESYADSIVPSQIIALQIMPSGSVKSGLKNLLESHRIKQDKEGAYYLPNYCLDELVEKLTP